MTATRDEHGVLPTQALRAMIARGAIAAAAGRSLPEQIQPASLDLRLGQRGLPGARLVPAGRGRPRRRPAAPSSRCTASTSAAGAVLEKGCVYVVPLMERLALPAGITRGRQCQKLDRAA